MLSARILGPLEVCDRDGPVPLGSLRQRTLLAALLCRANTVVPADELRAAVWPRHTSVNNLHVYVHRLRRTLRDPARIDHRPPGYVLRVDRAEVDAHRFEDLAGAGRRAAAAGDVTGAAARYRQALGLWRGDAFAGLDGCGLIGAEAGRLNGHRLRVLEWRIEADLVLGRAADLLPELDDLVRRYPFHEPFRRLRAGLGRPAPVPVRVAEPARSVPGHDSVRAARRLAAAGDHRRAIAAAGEGLRAGGPAQPLHELLGVCLREQGRYAPARRHLSIALAQAVTDGDPAAEARALQLLGIVAREEERFPAAARLLARAGALHHDLGDPVHQACLLLSTGELRLRAGTSPRRDVVDGLDRCRDLGSGFGVAYGLRLLGETELAARRPGRAVPLLRQAVRLSAATRNSFLLGMALRRLATAHAGAGHPTDAERAQDRADAVFAALGHVSTAGGR